MDLGRRTLKELKQTRAYISQTQQRSWLVEKSGGVSTRNKGAVITKTFLNIHQVHYQTTVFLGQQASNKPCFILRLLHFRLSYCCRNELA